MILTDKKAQRIAKKKYFQMAREYNEAREKLQQMYFDLVQQRTLAGLDDEIERPEICEVPEYIPGRIIQKNW